MVTKVSALVLVIVVGLVVLGMGAYRACHPRLGHHTAHMYRTAYCLQSSPGGQNMRQSDLELQKFRISPMYDSEIVSIRERRTAMCVR